MAEVGWEPRRATRGPKFVLTQEERATREQKYQKRYYHSEKGKLARRRIALKRYYGITTEEYNAMLAKQGGRCALCDRTGLHADHCHITGKFRGLLCRPHNVALGTLGDNEPGLLKALEYIRG